VHFGEAGFLVLSTEQQVAPFLPSVGNLAFLLFDGGAWALQLSSTVGSTEPLCTSGGWPSGATH
jgi:hypothetical protein